MKRVSSILAVLTLLFAGLCYYFLFYVDAGTDGLGTFFSISICGILFWVLFAGFALQLWSLKDIRPLYKLGYMTIIALPILFIFWKVFYPKEFTVQELDGIEVLE